MLTVLGLRGRLWLLVHGAQIRRQPWVWANHSRFLQLLWEAHRTRGQALSWQIAAQDRQFWRQWSDKVIRSKGHFEWGFYPRPHAIDLASRCLVRHHLGFHLLPSRIEPVEEPYGSSYVDVRASPRSNLCRQRTITSKVAEGPKNTKCMAVLIQPPAKPINQSWVRRQRTQAQANTDDPCRMRAAYCTKDGQGCLERTSGPASATQAKA